MQIVDLKETSMSGAAVRVNTSIAPTAPTVATVPIRKKKKRRQMVKITPWKDVYEWQSVAHGLKGALDLIQNGKIAIASFSCPTQVEDAHGNLRSALEMIRVWKARSSNALPHAIESSFSLALILLEDATSNNNNDDVLLQLSYSTAIIRSVNGLSDGLQQRRRLAAPVSQLCATLGLPVWIVDIRHEAAHNALPSLSQLRLAAHTVLGFFLEKYWQSSLSTSRQELLDSGKRMLQSYFNTGPPQQRRQPSTCSERDEPSISDPAQCITSALKDSKEVGEDVDDEQDDEEDPLDECDDDDADDAWLADNYFAALARETPAPKKAKCGSNQVTTATIARQSTMIATIPTNPESGSEREKDEVSRAASNIEVSMTSVVFFLKSLPQDVAYQVIVSFFIWGDDDTTGLLLRSSESENLYQPLLEGFCLAWPGLLSALLTHAVEYRLLHDEPQFAAYKDEGCSSCPLVDWLQRNRSFLEKHASAIPLRSLCTRLHQGNPLRRALEDIYQGVVAVVGESLLKDSSGEAIPPNWSVAEHWEPCTVGCLAGRTV